ncbi:hypothetical protein [Streptomyces sp. NPDC048639]
MILISGLGQRTVGDWTNGRLQWLACVLIALGRVLTTAVIAGVARALWKN